MGVSSGPKIVTNGLILALDAGSRKSTINSTNNLINNSDWVSTGTSVSPWPSNGSDAQNQYLFDTDPWGNQSLVLKTIPNNTEAGGGWEGVNAGYWVNADRSKKYRSTVWVRRTSSATAGNFYHGLHTNGTGDVIESDGNTETNPYWACQNIGYMTQNVWYLHVGHIFPYASTPQIDLTSGYWTRSGGYVGNPGCNITGYDPRFPSDATLLRQRTYHYYSTADGTSNIELFYPRIDLCDGSEPSIQEILEDAPSILYDQSGYNNHHTMTYKPKYETTTGGQFTLDGSTQGFFRNAALNGVSSTCTVVLWYKTTDTQELWVMGNNSGGVYLSASYGNDYYHGSCGTPTNYVDLNVVTNPETPVDYRNGNYHMWEAKGVDFSGWSRFDWFSYPDPWFLAGSVAKILVYNRSLSAAESQQNYAALRGRYGI